MVRRIFKVFIRRRETVEASDRLRVLASFIRFLEESLNYKFNVNREFEKRFLLQKYVFLARLFGLDMGYRFSLYLYGPYSSELADDYYEVAKKRGLALTPLPNTFEREGFINLVKDKDSTWLEIASSIILVKERYPNLSGEEAYNVLRFSKPWLSKELFDEVYYVLEGKRVIG